MSQRQPAHRLLSSSGAPLWQIHIPALQVAQNQAKTLPGKCVFCFLSGASPGAELHRKEKGGWMRGPFVLLLCCLILSPIKGHQSQPFNLFLLSPSLQFLKRAEGGGGGVQLLSSCSGNLSWLFGPQGKDPKQRPVEAPKAEPQLCISMLRSRAQEGSFFWPIMVLLRAIMVPAPHWPPSSPF